jgi:hypothetical protein
VWAVGYAGSQSVIENWNGSAWAVVSGPAVGSSDSLFLGIDHPGRCDRLGSREQQQRHRRLGESAGTAERLTTYPSRLPRSPSPSPFGVGRRDALTGQPFRYPGGDSAQAG